MKKFLLFLFFTLFSFSAIHAEKDGNIDWVFSDDGTLTISGTGDMPDYSDYAPWYKYINKIKKVVIKDGVTNIGDYAFLNFYYLTSITIPNSVASIGNYAFQNCKRLTSITIPNSVASIGNYAFQNCKSLTSITIPNSMTRIGDGIFSKCTSITSVIIPNSVTNIENAAFSDCSALTSLEIPNSVTSIGDYAFSNCKSLTSITIPNSVTSIGSAAFDGCSGLTSITFERTTVPWFREDVFNGVDESIPVYVPSISLDEYKEALGGWGFSNIQAIPPISLKDNASYTQDSQVEDVDVSYTRNFINTNWEALYLPFSLKYEDWKDDFEIAYISSVRQRDKNNDGTIDETILEFVRMKSGSTAPNTPYIIRAKEKGEKTLSAKNTTLYKAEDNSIDCSTTTTKFTFTGTYKGVVALPFVTVTTKKYYVINGEKFSNSEYVLPYHWYMTFSSRNSYYKINNAAKDITIRVLDEEETTGISQMQMENRQSSVYDMNGRMVNENSLKPGMYIKNGKKIIIK